MNKDTPRLKEFSKAVADKYEISDSLQPGKTIFPEKFGRKEMDLSNVPVSVVDAFVARYAEQPYFKLKKKSQSPAG
jgi:hypothetical protein